MQIQNKAFAEPLITISIQLSNDMVFIIEWLKGKADSL